MKVIPKFLNPFQPLGLSLDNTTIAQPINHSNMIRLTLLHEKALRKKYPNAKLSYGELAKLDRDINSKQLPVITNPPTRFETELMKQNRLAYQERELKRLEDEITPEQYGQALGALEFMGYASLPFDFYQLRTPLILGAKFAGEKLIQSYRISKLLNNTINSSGLAIEKFPILNIETKLYPKKSGIKHGYNTSGKLVKKTKTLDLYWLENITDPNNIPPRKLKSKTKTISTTYGPSKIKEIINSELLFLPLGNKVEDFVPDQQVTLFYKNRPKYVGTYYDPQAPITQEVKLVIDRKTLLANPIGTNFLLFVPTNPNSYIYSDIIEYIPLTYKHQKGGKLISKFQNSGKVRFYTNPLLNQGTSPLDPDLTEGIDYNYVTPEYYDLYKNKLKAKKLGAEGYFKSNLWESENPNKKGYNKNTNTWRSYNDGTGDYVGPGVDFNLYGTKEEINKVKNKTLSDNELNNMVEKAVKRHSDPAEKLLSKYTFRPDTISPLIKAGFYDILYQTGPNSDWPNLAEAIAEGNLLKIHKEAETYIKVNGKRKLDKRRLNERKKKYFYY